MTLEFDTGWRATQGARKYQEDACAITRLVAAEPSSDAPAESTDSASAEHADDPAALPILAVLADGMGGHVGGARASAVACRGFIDAYAGFTGTPHARLEHAISAANGAIAQAVDTDPALRGMGCTFIGVVLDGDALRWVSVGDSRLFLWRAGELYQLNEDHSLAPLLDRLAADGEMTPYEALHHPRRHHLRSALTGEDVELVDLPAEATALGSGDCIVLASDGIDTLEPDTIAELIDRHRAAGAEAVAEALVAAIDALAEPTQDNATVLALVS